MSDELWFRFFPSKFMSGIRGLGANEVKVYISLLCRMYERGGPLKNDAEILATYCELRPSSFEPALARLVRLEKIFLTDDGMLFNAAAEQEIARRGAYSENAKRAGKKSAEKRMENQGEQSADAQPTTNQIREEKRREDTPISPQGDQLELIPNQPQPQKPKRKPPSRPFPNDWAPSEQTVAWAMARGLSRATVDELALACKTNHQSKGNTFVDHEAAFRTWVINAPKFERSPQASQAQSGDGILRRLSAQQSGRL